MKKLPTLLAAMLLSAGIASTASADAFTDQVVADLTAKGYTHIEIKVGATTVKVEANNGTNTVEVTYDKATGEIIKSESGRVGAGDDTAPGVEVETGDDNGSDDDSEDDDSGHHGSGSGSDDDDDSDEDHSGSGHDGSDDDSGDDDNGDDDSGHDSGDDHGGESGNSGHGSDD